MQKWHLPAGSAFTVCPNNLEMAPTNCHCVNISFCKRGQQTYKRKEKSFIIIIIIFTIYKQSFLCTQASHFTVIQGGW